MVGKRIIVAPMTGPNSLKQRAFSRDFSLLKKTWRLCCAFVATLIMSMLSPLCQPEVLVRVHQQADQVAQVSYGIT